VAAPGQYVHFDIYLNGASQAAQTRADLVKRIETIYRLDRSDAAAFIASGQRIRVRRGVDQDAAMRTLLELQQLGAVVEVEPNRPPEAALANLDEFPDAMPATESPMDGIPPVGVLKDALMSLDGAQPEENTIDREAPTVSGPGSVTSDDPITGAATNPLVARAVEPPVAAAPAADPSEEDRFRPRNVDSQSLQLEIDVVPQPRRAAPLPPEALEAEPIRMCEEHELPEPCSACAKEDEPIPGRIMQGALRKQPLVRLGIGLALGLLVGYLASMPYSNRAEKRVAATRAEADVNRYKNDPELQRDSARLDAQAEAQSNSAAFGTIAIWLVVGGAVVAGWFRAT
jgi:hypothetical protein